MSDISDPTVSAASNLAQCLIPAGQLNTSNKRDLVTITPAAIAALSRIVGGALSTDANGNPLLTLTFGDGSTFPISLAGLSASGSGTSTDTPDGSITDPQGAALTDPQGNVVTNN